jgi:starch phosphorylase
MRPIHTLTISPSLPPRLERLRDLAYNLWWAWHLEAIDLFRRLDRDLWETSGHNPVLMLGTVAQEKLENAAQDEAFLAHMDRVLEDFDRYMTSTTTWYRKQHTFSDSLTVAYFSAEFGLTDCIHNYSGGLGVLAGDHLKSASDLGLPLVGVGLLYQQGYFHQYLSSDGWQQEEYPLNDFYTMPLRVEHRADGSPVIVEIEYPGQRVKAQVWRVQVGRVPLFLLDTNLEANPPEQRDITFRLYGGDNEMRIRQEMLIGIGGLRALRAVGIDPAVCHINEGHSAFLTLERIRMLMADHNLSFAEAREATTAGNIFTTHTPVPAGIDIFPPNLMEKYFGGYYRALGLSAQEFLALGRVNSGDQNEPFSMAVLALRLCAYSNAVSRLHGSVSRRMWQGMWPDVPENEIPISSVTNGIHTLSWVSQDMAALYDRYLGPAWRDDPADTAVWQRTSDIPDEELWRTHERRRGRLIAFARRKRIAQLTQRGAPHSEIQQAQGALDPSALTIGFARRFATYKRATLLFRDRARLARILNDPERPVQIIFAGKAHPMDQPGKELIRQVVSMARQEEFRQRIVFIEDYGMGAARYMLQGVDVWLNTPRRPREASGTSGMKAAANGAINLSIPDGWWDEAYRPEVGWAIGRGEVYDNNDYQDDLESAAIYDLLEKDVVPLFYDCGPDGLPRGWMAKMKAAMKEICPAFSTHRMVREYAERFYMPAAVRSVALEANDLARAKALAEWEAKVRRNWPELRVVSIETDTPSETTVGTELVVKALLHLGALEPADVTVQLYHGPLDTRSEITPGQATAMEWKQKQDDEGNHLFVGSIPLRSSGRYGYTLRVLPRHEDLANPHHMGLILWAQA